MSKQRNRSDHTRHSKLIAAEGIGAEPVGPEPAREQDRAFQQAMILALSRRSEHLPPEHKSIASVPRRLFATAFIATASSLADC